MRKGSEEAELIEEKEADWICDIVKNTCQNYRGRKIILWGKFGAAERIAGALDKFYGIQVSGYIESNKLKINDFIFYTPDFFAKACKEDYYIVVPLGFNPDIVDTLCKCGFEKNVDYYYFAECILKQEESYYEDAHGNRIIGNAGKIQIVFLGFCSTVIIHENAILPNSGKIYIYSEAVLEIGARTQVTFSPYISIGKNAKVRIGADCAFRIRSMLVKPYAEFETGDKITTGSGTMLNICEWSKVKIGEDCMFSHDVKIYSNDAHSIFDLTSGKNINSTEEICKKRNIFIGNHVWIGMCVAIMYGSEIGNGSIVGAESLVKGIVPENCIACGSPAKVTRRNIAWSRENCADDLQISMTS